MMTFSQTTMNQPATSMSPTQLAHRLNELLKINEFQDYCPNGLQVDGGQPIQHILTGVTASEALIEQAIAHNAQAILVHHGYFWKGEPAPLIGMKGKRIRLLIQHGISGAQLRFWQQSRQTAFVSASRMHVCETSFHHQGRARCCCCAPSQLRQGNQ